MATTPALSSLAFFFQQVPSAGGAVPLLNYQPALYQQATINIPGLAQQSVPIPTRPAGLCSQTEPFQQTLIVCPPSTIQGKKNGTNGELSGVTLPSLCRKSFKLAPLSNSQSLRLTCDRVCFCSRATAIQQEFLFPCENGELCTHSTSKPVCAVAADPAKCAHTGESFKGPSFGNSYCRRGLEQCLQF